MIFSFTGEHFSLPHVENYNDMTAGNMTIVAKSDKASKNSVNSPTEDINELINHFALNHFINMSYTQIHSRRDWVLNNQHFVCLLSIIKI